MTCPVSIQASGQRTVVQMLFRSAEQLIELVERGRRCRGYRERINHIVECPMCRAAYREMLATEQVIRGLSEGAGRLRRLFWWLAPATAAAVGAIILLWLLVGRSYPAWQVAVRVERGAVYEGALRLPDWAAKAALQFPNPPSVTRSESASAPLVRLLQPVDEGLTDPRPVFEWASVPDASGYRATLIAEPDGDTISLRINGTRATLPPGKQLQAGATYQLTITVLSPDALPGSEPRQHFRFRMLTAQEREQLNWARQHRQRAPYTCTMLFYRLGRYREALQALPNRPNDPLVQRWRAALTQSLPNNIQPAQ